LLAGQRPYREYPLDWLIRHLERLGFCVIKAQKFPITYTSTFIHRQISVGESKLQHIHPAMSQGLATRYSDLVRILLDFMNVVFHVAAFDPLIWSFSQQVQSDS